jgi:N-methylhydantoinase A
MRTLARFRNKRINGQFLAAAGRGERMSRNVVGVDVGGTFTDLLLVDEDTRRFTVAKVPTTPQDQSTGFLDGIVALNVPPGNLEAIIHGTTIGTNAVLERKGACCGIITTRGFRDVLELGRRTRPYAYGMIGSFEAVIPREFRLEATERIDADGRVVTPLDEDDVRRAVRQLLDMGAEALVIHFIHAYANPSHEERALKIARTVWPNDYITLGSRTLREVREFERGSTAAINGYIQPVISRYVSRVSAALAERKFGHELLLMQGNGGMMAAGVAGDHSVHTVMSGPAAGAIAAAATASQADFRNVISCDMGGTSFDVAVIIDGTPAVSNEKDIAYGVPVRVPMVDIHTISAGGGSIARIDKAGILRAGPDSAGSTPGPIAYGRGGTEPTITDANLVLGRLNPAALTGTTRAADPQQIGAVLEGKIGRRLDLDSVQTADAIVTVANNNMAGAIRLVSMAKGHDPRNFVLFAFGGAGPLHAVALARELGIPKVLVPRYPGITSAMGCILADVRHDFVQTVNRPLLDIEGGRVDAIYRDQADAGRALLAREGIVVTGVEVVHEGDLLYQGQSHVLRIPVESPGFDRERVLQDFVERYRTRFDIELPEMCPVLMSLRTTVIGRRPPVDLHLLASNGTGTLAGAVIGRRPTYFDGSWHETIIYRRDGLPANVELSGPAIVEQSDTTIFIDPPSKAVTDSFGNLIVTVGSQTEMSR